MGSFKNISACLYQGMSDVNRLKLMETFWTLYENLRKIHSDVLIVPFQTPYYFISG
jgi:hypothetical protein